MDDIKHKLIKLKDTFYQKYWPDPVWSKVISTIIIAISSSILTAIYILLKSLYDKVSFKAVTLQVIEYFKLTTEINNLILGISILIIFLTVYSFFKSLMKDIINKIRTKNIIAVECTEEPKELPIITEHSTAFFFHRLAKSFPGQRGLMWYGPMKAIERFKILFQEPLSFKSEGHYGSMPDPIWWFRGGAALSIEKFKILSKTKVLLGWHELEIKKVAVYISESYYKCFIYVETKAEKQTGLYNYKLEDIKRKVDNLGYSSEEYALLGNKLIRREDYDDGATVIKNKVVDATNAELRLRFLSDYNFIIAAKQSPYNSHKFNRESKRYLNNILQGKQTPESFFEFLETFEKQTFID